MALVFTSVDGGDSRQHAVGDLLELVGTITFSGNYAAGGDTFASGQNLEDLLKRTGRGKVLFVHMTRGFTAEWDSTAKKLKLYQNGAEVAAAGYAGVLTATPVPVIVKGR